MGAYLSIARNVHNINDRLNRLEADLNKDGIVTRDELIKYNSKEIELRDSEIVSLRSDKIKLEAEISKLNNDLISWKSAYNDLHKKHESYISSDIGERPVRNSQISNKAINCFVEEILADPNLNIQLIPDKIEKPMYVNTLKIMLSVMEKVFNNINIDVIGHELKVQIKPSDDEKS